jgi:hypothetical protein
VHNEEPQNLRTSPNIIHMMKFIRVGWAGHVACMVVMRNAYKILVRRPEGKRQLGRLRHR